MNRSEASGFVQALAARGHVIVVVGVHVDVAGRHQQSVGVDGAATNHEIVQ